MYDFNRALHVLREWRAGKGPPPSYDNAHRLRKDIASENAQTAAVAAKETDKKKRAEIEEGTIRDGPQLWDLVQVRHPHLICTDDKDGKQEWLEYTPAGWHSVANVKNLVRLVMDDIGIAPEARGVESKVSAIVGRLGAKRRIRNLVLGEACRIDYGAMRATPLRDVKGVDRVIGCASQLVMVDERGYWAGEPYSSALYVPVRLPADPAPASTPTPFIDGFLRTLLKDDDRIAAWNDWCCYCFSPGNWHKRILLLVSPKDSGKTTLLLLLRTLLGESNCQAMAAKDMNNSHFHARMRTCLVNISEEDVGYGKDFEGLVKAVSGGSPISFNIKYGAIGSYVPGWKPVLAGNDAPTLVDETGAYAGRLLTLRTEPIPKDIQIKKPETWWKSKFLKEMPAYLRRLLDRMPDIEANGLTIPEDSEEDVYQLRLESSPILQWLDESAVFDPAASHPRDEVYRSYKAWATMNGSKPVSKSAFYKKFRALPEVRARLRAGDVDFDIRLGSGTRERRVQGVSLVEDRATQLRLG